MKKLLVCLVFAGAIGGAYYNTLGNDFVFDDYLLVVENPFVRSTKPLSEFLLAPLSLGYRPFRTLSYVIDARIGGVQPWVFHASNLFYHWLTTCLVFLVTLRLTNMVPERQADALPLQNDTTLWRWRPAIFVTALWALHPLQTDAVTYISGRRDILGGLCLFLGLWTYGSFRIAELHAGVWRYGWLVLSCVVYGLGILSKESVIVLPVLCWMYDIQREGIVESLRRRWAIYFLVLLLGFAVLWYFAGPIFFMTIQNATWHGGSLEGNFATVARIWQHYLSLMVYPHTLLADYSYNAFPASSSFGETRVLVALGTLTGAVIGISLLAWQWPLCRYGGLWMLVSILPVSHLIPIKEVVAEHYLYVPLFGFCLIVGVVLAALCGDGLTRGATWSRVRAATVYGVVVLLLVGSVLRTVTRNRDWADEETFWTVVTQTAPQGARGHYNLAGTYKRLQRPGDAAREFMVTLAISPQHVGAIVGLGELAFEAGHYGQSLAYAKQAQVIDPQHPRVIYLLSWVKLALKEIDEAEQLFLQAATLMPNSSGVYAGLEAVAKERGDKEAEKQWADKRQALEGRHG
ncbi:MAG: tetratricopeptide repeat protein [Candidatus Binatia bacterium]